MKKSTSLILISLVILTAGILTITSSQPQDLPQDLKKIFKNIQPRSDIDFSHKILDDSGLKYKANHYDHGSGLAAADVDNDGLIDLYFVNQFRSNELYKNLGGGKFKDITKSSQTGTPDRVSVTAAFADYDNDGDNDLYVSAIHVGNLLFENDGKGIFTNVTEKSGVEYFGHPATAIFFDYNNDSFLDLFLVSVGEFTDPSEVKAKKLGFYEGYNNAFSLQFKKPGESAKLWKNNGDKTFKDVTDQVEININNWTGAVTLVDFNNDQFMDLYITSMAGENHLLENIAGKKFKEVTEDYFPKTPWGAMGAKFFDYNNDGMFDLYVTDMHSDMMTPKSSQFAERDLKSTDLSDLTNFIDPSGFDDKRYIYGSAFFKNSGNNKFEEVSDSIGAETYWPWGISIGDIDADGYEDIFLASGMGYPFHYQENVLLKNISGENFVHKEYEYGIEFRENGNEIAEFFVDKNGKKVAGSRSARSSVIFDMDNDGDLDIVTNEFNDHPQLFENAIAQQTNLSYIKILLIGTKSNRNGIGSIIILEDEGGNKQFRLVDGNSGYFGFSQLPVYFALPNGSKSKKITIRWPSGQEQEIMNPEMNTALVLNEQ